VRAPLVPSLVIAAALGRSPAVAGMKMAYRQDPSQMPGALSIGPAWNAPGYGGPATRDRQAFGLACVVWARFVRRVQEASERLGRLGGSGGRGGYGVGPRVVS
jgi:hypothetical protein